jgi:hypothetical protein
MTSEQVRTSLERARRPLPHCPRCCRVARQCARPPEPPHPAVPWSRCRPRHLFKRREAPHVSCCIAAAQTLAPSRPLRSPPWSRIPRPSLSPTNASSSHPRTYFSDGPPWTHCLSGYEDQLLGGSLGLIGLCHTAPDGVRCKDYGGEVLG